MLCQRRPSFANTDTHRYSYTYSDSNTHCYADSNCYV